MELTRRSLGLAVGAGLLLPWGHAAAKAARPTKLPTLALSAAVAELEGEPVVSEAWLREQLSEVSRLMSPHGITIELWRQHVLPDTMARLENAADRDGLAVKVGKDVVNAFFVATLRDVDLPERLIQGVRWRLRRDVRKDYVIVAAGASPTTLTHELGHYFGNGHSTVVNNVMSYLRDDPSQLAFDRKQGARMRQVAQRRLQLGQLVSIEKLREAEAKKQQ